MNRENAEKLAAYLETLPPEKFDMMQWCGTACCIAGHAAALSGEPPSDEPRDAEYAARQWLGISGEQSDQLFLIGKAWGGISVESYSDATPQAAARAVRRAIELWCDR